MRTELKLVYMSFTPQLESKWGMRQEIGEKRAALPKLAAVTI